MEFYNAMKQHFGFAGAIGDCERLFESLDSVRRRGARPQSIDFQSLDPSRLA